MGEDLYRESLASLRPGGLAPLVEKYRPDILFFNPGSARQWMIDVKSLADWRLVYADEGAAVFLRKDYAPEIPPADSSRLLAERGISRESVGTARALLSEPARPEWQRVFESFYRPAVHPNGLQVLAVFYWYRGDFDTA